MSAPPGSFFAANRGGPARAHSPNGGRTRSPESRLYVVDPPPFGTGSERFNKLDRGGGSGSPNYHVAYRDTMQPTKKEVKGWTGIDDSIKRGRGTGAGKTFSSMATPVSAPATGATLQPLSVAHPNEMRLQELLNLQRRKLGQLPGPGAYEAPAFQSSKTSFRRTNVYQLDGPYLPPAGTNFVTTRSKEIDRMLKYQPDSGRCPGDYESHVTKDALSRTAPATTIGNASRGGRTEQAKSLSLSRSIQHGIDWHVPVIIKLKQVEEENGMDSQTYGDKRRGRRKAATDSGATAAKPQGKTSAPPGSAPLLDSTKSRVHDISPPRVREPDISKPPMPPAAVARSVRRPQANVPGEWDWNKLGHNYRSNWTTLHGGAYSLGDRSTLRKDARKALGEEDEEEEEYGGHPQHHPQPGTCSADESQEGSPVDGFRSIDPLSLPFNGIGDTMFPIPEEQTEMYTDIGAPISPGITPDSPRGGKSLYSTGRSDMSGFPGGPGFGPPQGELIRGSYYASPGLLSQQEMQRRESAAAAAAFVQASNMRRSEWLAKSDMLAA